MQEQYIPDYNNVQDKKYIELRAIIAQVNKVLNEMDFVLQTSRTKVAAARTIQGKWVPKMDVALEDAEGALIQWMMSLNSVTE